MPRTKKTIDLNSVNIADFCQSQGINEQIFRLELMAYSDNADSIKDCGFDVATEIANNITAPKSALPESQENPESLTPQGLQPASQPASQQPQQPQHSSIATSANSTINKPAASPDAIQELLIESEEYIELADLVHSFRNQQILQNKEARDRELIISLREKRLSVRGQVFEGLRELNHKQPPIPDLPELPPSLKDEIKSIAGELGKRLSA